MSEFNPKGRSFWLLWEWLWREVRAWCFTPFSVPTLPEGTVGARKAVDQEEHIILVRCIQQHPFFHIMAASGTAILLRSICSILLNSLFQISEWKLIIFSSFKIRGTIVVAMAPTQIQSSFIGGTLWKYSSMRSWDIHTPW